MKEIIKEIADRVARTLNDALKGAALCSESPENNLIPNVNFEFDLAVETGEVKRPKIDENNPNVITEYICSIFRVMPGTTNEGYGAADFIASVPVTMEFLIPYANLTDEYGEPYFVNAVLAVLQDVLQFNQHFPITSNGVEYQITAAYSAPFASTREIRSTIGDSVPVQIQAMFAIVAGGLSPENTKLWVEDANGKFQQIQVAQLNVARTTQMDGNYLSGGDGTAKCVSSGTRLVITVNSAVRGTVLDDYHTDYLVYGALPTFNVMLNIKGKENTYKMSFMQGEIGIQVPSLPAEAITLVEVI